MNIIVAVNNDWGIGYEGAQTCVIPEDRMFFKAVTEGGVIISGRKTFEEIGRPLPNRKNIILTRDPNFAEEGVVVARSMEEVMKEIEGEDQDSVYVIGGGEIYTMFLPLTSRAFVTKIDTSPPSDTFFPNLDALPTWSIERRSEKKHSNTFEYSILIYRNDALLGYMHYARG